MWKVSILTANPSVLRATVAVFWYGVQVYFASTAVALLIHSLTGTTGGAEYLGLSAVDWISFVIVWAFHILIFWRGMDWVETFLNIAGPFVYAVMIGLVIVLWFKSDGQLLSQARTIFVSADATWTTEINGFIAIVGTMVAYFAAVMINFSDFSRYAAPGRKMVTPTPLCASSRRRSRLSRSTAALLAAYSDSPAISS